MNTEATSQMSKEVHIGKNVKRLREILGIKQEVLADGLNMSQQSISRLESQKKIDDDLINKIANILNIPVDAIKSYNDDVAVNIISNTFNEQSVAYQHNSNPIDKIMQLYNEKIELYERLLKSEQDKSFLLEKQLEEQQK
jgi:Predicted transcriptional regulators